MLWEVEGGEIRLGLRTVCIVLAVPIIWGGFEVRQSMIGSKQMENAELDNLNESQLLTLSRKCSDLLTYGFPSGIRNEYQAIQRFEWCRITPGLPVQQ